MKIKPAVCVLLISSALFLPGCGRLIDWGKNTFYQGQELDEGIKHAQSHVRWATVYNQLETYAMFDAIWLSDDVRTSYARLHTFRQGKNEEHRTAFLRRQLEENNHYITFYVLSLYNIPLGDPESAWLLFLDVDGKQILPIEVKSVDLPQEYKAFLGKRFTRFKDAYRVKFDAKDIEGRSFITDNTQNIKLYFRTIDKQAVLTWDLGGNGILQKQPMTGSVPKLIEDDE